MNASKTKATVQVSYSPSIMEVEHGSITIQIVQTVFGKCFQIKTICSLKIRHYAFNYDNV